MRRTSGFSRRVDGGGYVRELCFFLMVIGSIIASGFAILRPRRPGERPGHE